jgi:hypothetical protein
MKVLRTFLSVSCKDPFAGAGDDVPDSHCAVIAARHKRPTSSSQRTDGVIVSNEMQLVIRIVINMFLKYSSLPKAVSE